MLDNKISVPIANDPNNSSLYLLRNRLLVASPKREVRLSEILRNLPSAPGRTLIGSWNSRSISRNCPSSCCSSSRSRSALSLRVRSVISCSLAAEMSSTNGLNSSCTNSTVCEVASSCKPCDRELAVKLLSKDCRSIRYVGRPCSVTTLSALYVPAFIRFRIVFSSTPARAAASAIVSLSLVLPTL